jgi:hypothetical protein
MPMPEAKPKIAIAPMPALKLAQTPTVTNAAIDERPQ